MVEKMAVLMGGLMAVWWVERTADCWVGWLGCLMVGTMVEL
jgi:hypothetical protein